MKLVYSIVLLMGYSVVMQAMEHQPSNGNGRTETEMKVWGGETIVDMPKSVMDINFLKEKISHSSTVVKYPDLGKIIISIVDRIHKYSPKSFVTLSNRLENLEKESFEQELLGSVLEYDHLKNERDHKSLQSALSVWRQWAVGGWTIAAFSALIYAISAITASAL